VPNARPIPTRRRTFSPKQKARILEDAKSGVSHAARKHQVARSVIDRWRRELAA
jgi:transposase-like protein